MKKKIETVIFDLDNTLYHHSTGFMKELDRRIESYIKKRLLISDSDAEHLRLLYNKKYGTVLTALKEYHHVDVDEYIDYIYGFDIESFFREDAELFEMLFQIKKRKVIFTNSPEKYALRILKSLGIAQFFEEIYGINFLHHISKPSRTAFMRMFEVGHIDPKTALFIDDTVRNLHQAKLLGLTTVLLGDTLKKPSFADHKIEQITELKGLLDKIEGKK